MGTDLITIYELIGWILGISFAIITVIFVFKGMWAVSSADNVFTDAFFKIGWGVLFLIALVFGEGVIIHINYGGIRGFSGIALIIIFVSIFVIACLLLISGFRDVYGIVKRESSQKNNPQDR